jgi:hypothetical protein
LPTTGSISSTSPSVTDGIKAGRSLEELQKAQIMSEYKGWIEYDEDNDINIAHAYRGKDAVADQS